MLRDLSTDATPQLHSATGIIGMKTSFVDKKSPLLKGPRHCQSMLQEDKICGELGIENLLEVVHCTHKHEYG